LDKYKSNPAAELWFRRFFILKTKILYKLPEHFIETS